MDSKSTEHFSRLDQYTKKLSMYKTAFVPSRGPDYFYGFPGIEEIACFLRPPAYVTCEWALNYHGITLQAPFVCTAATLSSSVGKSREIEYQGITIELSKISPKLFFGYEMHKNFYLVTPEKALVDTLYHRGNHPVADELELEGMNRGRLMETAKQFPSSIFRKLTLCLDTVFDNAV